MKNSLKKQGLYDPINEKSSCGIGFVANIYDIPSRQIIDYGLNILCNITHRGAVSADPKAGDGVGILTQIPHQFFQKELAKNDVILPRPEDYAVGMFFQLYFQVLMVDSYYIPCHNLVSFVKLFYH